MYLKKLEMKGFKSFADKLNLDFESGVTCVVGPNGSGKSNITDAVRWVLGEQKIKTLRGSKMEDVIFNGTKNRKALGVAEVSLTFDNQDQNLKLDYNEVCVTRRVYRSGDSEYYINDSPCRLKDVRELFMDTGIGTDGYSIIGQGRIDRILSNKPEERRQIFEEAAGIVKYKSRKREAERKLENTNNNLLRVEDIVNELAVRVGPLKEASEKATQYLEFSQEMKGLEINQFIKETDSVKEELKKEIDQIEIFKKELIELQLRSESIKEKNASLAESIFLKEEESLRLDESYEETLKTLNANENELVVLEEKLIHSKANRQRLLNEINKLQEQEIEIRDQIREQSSVKISLEEDIKEVELVINQHEKEKERQEILYKEKESFNQESRERIIEILNIIERKKIEISNFETSIKAMEKRLEEIGKELIIERSKEETKELSIDQLSTELLELEKYLENRLLKREEVKNHLLNKEEQYKLKKNEIDIDQNSLIEYEAEYKLLKEMEANYEGYGNSVRDALLACKKDKNLGKGIHGVVAELFQIPEKFESAIDVILGRNLQNVVADTADDAKRVIKYLKNNKIGRVTFVPLSNIKSNDEQKKEIEEAKKIDGYIGIAKELVYFDIKYATLFDYLLNRVIIVENIDVATEMLKIKNLKYRIVTLDGDLVIPGGTITGGSRKPQKTNILSRKRRIFELDNIIDSLKIRIKDLSELISKYEKEISEHKTEFEELNGIIEEYKIDQVRKKNELDNEKKEMETLLAYLLKLETEKKTLKKEIEEKSQNVISSKEYVVKLNLENEQLEEAVLSHSGEIDNVKNQIMEIHEKIIELKVERASILEKYEHRLETLERLSSQLNESSEELKIIQENLEQIDNEAIDYTNRKGIISENIEKSRLSLQDLKQNQITIRDILESNKSECIEHEKTEIRCQSRISEITSLSQHHDNQKRKLESKYGFIINNMWEKYEISYLEALELRMDIDDDIMNKRIRILKKSIRELGEVNINSIKEYSEVSERYEFLTEQQQDLLDAQKHLNKIIRDLEKAMKQQFLEYFVEINKHFKEIFKVLFSGGQADLILSDTESVLDSDVEIVAQPPGKKLQNLELMSGGERALTAIALLFAILKSKPTPFCILDEIEAALDDVNVYRFAEFLKEFTQKSQFIVITHRKGTMEIADNLYGVTMEEYGVSKILSVKLEDVAI